MQVVLIRAGTPATSNAPGRTSGRISRPHRPTTPRRRRPPRPPDPSRGEAVADWTARTAAGDGVRHRRDEGEGMHVRSTTVMGDPASIDDGVAYLRDKVMPTLDRTTGCLGLSMLADRESGRCIAATAWETQDAMRATNERLRASRGAYALACGGDNPDVQEWEIAVLHREHPAGDGAGAQVAWARIQPNHVDDLIHAYRANLMPKLADLPGFC